MAAKKGHREFFEVYRTSPEGDKSKPEEKEVPKKRQNIQISDRDETEKHRQVTKAAEPRTPKYEPGKWIKKREKDPDVNIAKSEAQARKYEPQKWIKKTDKTHDINVSKKVTHVPPDDTETLSGKLQSLSREGVKLSQETILIFAVAATFLLIACFFVGYKVGHNKGSQLSAENTTFIKDEQKVSIPQDDVKDEDVSLNLFSKNKSDETDISGVQRSSDDLWTLRMISYRNISSNLSKATKLAKAIKNMTGANAFVAKSGNELIVCVGKFKGDNDQGLIDLQIKMAGLVYENKKQFKGCYPVKLK